MRPPAHLQAVIELLTDIDATPRPADALVSAYFRSRRYIGSSDRGAVSTMLYDVLRHRARMDWWVDYLGGQKTDIRLRLLTYLTLVQKKSAAEIDEFFDSHKFSPDELSGDERRFIKKLEGRTLEHPNMPIEISVECPEWAATSLHKRFGKKFAAQMKALLDPAPLDVRINPLRTTRDDILVALKKIPITAEPCRYSGFGIRIKNRPSLNALPMLKDGLIEIQDEGSQLVAALVDAAPGMRVVDFCAGAGGKTLAIGAQMNNKGRIIACDVLEKRLTRSAERFRRAGLHNIEVRPLKTENDPWVKKHKSDFDRVLVDAPCSGVGTWRRNPDARWQTLGPGLDALLPLQASILDSASRLVKSGGRLIYATCSLLPEENEKQIERFLADHSDFSVINCGEFLKISSPSPYLSLTPFEHNTDGFFGAVLLRA
jgi:16S rRNA (cytosine967-C5)-methyltransferase